MINAGQNLVRIIIALKLFYVIGDKSKQKVTNPLDWRVVESLAEEYPHVVALLNTTKDYMCTGVIIKRNTVLTSGNCISPSLQYIAIGNAVISKGVHGKSLHKIASTAVHTDYIFELTPADPNVTQMHSNVGLVFSEVPTLDTHMPTADVGNYFASELEKKNLRVVGFGKVNETNMVVLQSQLYHQSPCSNPKWYYCVCGLELTGYSKSSTAMFGEGAPVFLGSHVVGIAAVPCGSMELRTLSLKYNVFTVLGPYLQWIEKKNSNFTARVRTVKAEANKQLRVHYFCMICNSVVVIRVLFH